MICLCMHTHILKHASPLLSLPRACGSPCKYDEQFGSKKPAPEMLSGLGSLCTLCAPPLDTVFTRYNHVAFIPAWPAGGHDCGQQSQWGVRYLVPYSVIKKVRELVLEGGQDLEKKAGGRWRVHKVEGILEGLDPDFEHYTLTCKKLG